MNFLNEIFGKKDEEQKKEILRLLDASAILLDVRECCEYDLAHIPDSINLPLSCIADAEKSLAKDKALIVYCQSGGRSPKAVRKLKEMGYLNICDAGGINNVAAIIKAKKENQD